jgi:uncharacterized protein (TIGR02444 family)
MVVVVSGAVEPRRVEAFPTKCARERDPCDHAASSMPASRDNPLWRFAVSLYGRGEVAAACLELQDAHGLDVDLVLACLWYACDRRHPLERTRLRELQHRVAPLRQWTVRMRQLRRELERPSRLDPSYRELYDHAKTTELSAEALSLAVLYDALAADPRGEQMPAIAAEASLYRYAEIEGAAGAEPLLHALVAALPDDGH